MPSCISLIHPPRLWKEQFRLQFSRLRRSEQVLLGYFTYTAVMGMTFGVHPLNRVELLAINVAIGLAFLFLVARAPLDAEWRDGLPYPLSLLCYREAGWLSSVVARHNLEQRWVVWDRLVLDTWHGRSAVEAFGASIPNLLEGAYLSVYVIAPMMIASLYALRRRGEADRLWTALLLGLMLAYIQFPFWPSEPPRAVFPGSDMPNYFTRLRQLNLFLVGNYGIHSSVFPSAHVSGAMAGALTLRRVLPDR